MPYEIEYDTDSACMMCRMAGKIDQQLVRDFLAELVTLVEKHRCTRTLNDLREADLALSMLDIYGIPKLISQAGLGPTTKRAVVVSASRDDYHFFETVSVNLGQYVRVFTDFDKALKWVTAKQLHS
jgi:hypothetical protein